MAEEVSTGGLKIFTDNSVNCIVFGTELSVQRILL